MRQPPAYERDPYRRELDTEVIDAGQDGGRPWVALGDTIFYPEGGGQPADLGTIGEARVAHVARERGIVRHFLDRPLAAGPVRLRLDWERRFDHMQHHTGQHLLSALAEDRFGWATTSFHLGAGRADVELGVAALGREELERLEEAVAEEIRRARPVRPRRVEPGELAGLRVRTRGLPGEIEGGVRLVEIEGVDLNTCGGTHLGSTGEIETLCLIGTEKMRGGTRLYFVAGRRARRRMAAHEQRTGALCALVGSTEEALVEATRGRLDKLAELGRRERQLGEALAERWAAALAARPEPAVEAHFEGLDGAFLARVAAELGAAAPAKLALLTASRGGECFFAVAAGPSSAVDLKTVGAAVAELLGGRGGGAQRLYQGKAAGLEGRAEAVARLVAAAGG